jgi:cell pole-organizing protein PopZ
MDEILASIRRIIESNDPVPQAGVATGMAEPEGFSGRPANDDSEEVTLTVDSAFADRDHQPVEISPPVLKAVAEAGTHAESTLVGDLRQPGFSQPAAAPQKSLSLADVAARVRAASERSSAERAGAASEDIRPIEHPAASAREEVQPAAATHEPVRMPPVAAAREKFVSDSRAAPSVHAQEDEEPYKSEPLSLLSSSAGEQVARSFQDLAIAIDNAERRSFDEIAEDMLRPMLQEWLDDNLPTLVERLVREEIERVARGPRR